MQRYCFKIGSIEIIEILNINANFILLEYDIFKMMLKN